MTPKEKAKELFDRYYAITGPFTEAKQCALIAVDEMLKTNWINVWEKDYWSEVKQEIEKI